MQVKELVTIGKDIELVYANNGTAIAKTSVALSRSEKKADKWEKVTDWYNIVAFSKTAERLSTYCQKGHRILLNGILKQNEYVAKDGTKKRDYVITVENFEFIEKAQGGNTTQSRVSYSAPKQNNYQTPTSPQVHMDNEELPF